MDIYKNINVINCNYNNPALITPIIVYYLTPTSYLSLLPSQKNDTNAIRWW